VYFNPKIIPNIKLAHNTPKANPTTSAGGCHRQWRRVICLPLVCSSIFIPFSPTVDDFN